MKFNCGKRSGHRRRMARLRALRLWHPWFAWHPVRVGPHDCRWGELVWRKGEHHTGWDYDGVYSNWTWEYR